MKVNPKSLKAAGDISLYLNCPFFKGKFTVVYADPINMLCIFSKDQNNIDLLQSYFDIKPFKGSNEWTKKMDSFKPVLYVKDEAINHLADSLSSFLMFLDSFKV